MKRTCSLLLALALLMGLLSGCGGQAPAASTPASDAPSAAAPSSVPPDELSVVELAELVFT